MNGFHGRILDVDLDARRFRIETVADDILKTYLGGKAWCETTTVCPPPCTGHWRTQARTSRKTNWPTWWGSITAFGAGMIRGFRRRKRLWAVAKVAIDAHRHRGAAVGSASARSAGTAMFSAHRPGRRWCTY